MPKVEYTGGGRTELWDGRVVSKGDVIDVTPEQAKELTAPGRNFKTASQRSATPAAKE